MVLGGDPAPRGGEEAAPYTDAVPPDGGSATLEKGAAIETVHENDGLGRVLTVPNGISFARLGLVAVFLYLLFDRHDRVAAVVVLAAAGASDFFDGYLARRLGQVTTLGKVLDPAADRIVVGSGVVAIAVYGAAPVWLAAAVLGREALVTVAVLALAALHARRIDVLFVGKAGTFGLMVSFPLMLLADTHASWGHVLADVTWAIAAVALALSFYATWSYVPVARRALGERAVARQVAAP